MVDISNISNTPLQTSVVDNGSGQISYDSGGISSSSVLTPALPSSSTSISSIGAYSSSTATSYSNSGLSNDFRVRLAYLSGQSNAYPGILAPLANTNGLLFPYQPSISVGQVVDYDSVQMTHANQNYETFARSKNTSIGIVAKFAIQNYQDGIYTLAAIHFLRSVTKMYFGENDPNAGIPPPVLSLNGYGTYMFNQLRVICTGYNYNLDESVNMITITVGSGYVRLPVTFSININLITQNTARAQRQDFILDNFRSGALMASPPNNSGWF